MAAFIRRIAFALVFLPLLAACLDDGKGKDADPDETPDYPGGPTEDGDTVGDGDEEPAEDGDEPEPDPEPVDGDDGELPDGDEPDDPPDEPDGDEPVEDGDDDPIPPPVYQSDAEPFEPGRLEVQRIDVTKGGEGPPVDLMILSPVEEGDYAVVVFQHGFMMANRYYSKILTSVASHGFIVVAPQMYAPGIWTVGRPNAWEEAFSAAQVYSWLDSNLSRVTGVRAHTDRMGLAGHSRGGKVIWIVLSQNPQRARAVVGVDPVDGQGGPLGGELRVIDGAFNFPFPSLVIGTGLGSTGLSPCAPTGDNHIAFYGASASPAIHHVATDYGHNDMMDEKNPENCGTPCTVCASNDNIVLMRTYTAGALATFFRWTLQEQAAMLDILLDTDAIPVRVSLARK